MAIPAAGDASPMRHAVRVPIRRPLALAILLMGLGRAASGQDPEHHPGWMDSLRSHLPGAASAPTVSDLGRRIDHVAEGIRNDGIVALKQPDVYSQARLTKYRQDFENEMLFELGTFKMILSARIGRLDSATTTSTTTLGASLAPPGSTHVTTPSPTVPAFGPADQIDFKNTPFGNLTVGQTNHGNLGVEPTVYLEEKKRFLEHLNEIRRISLGPDQNDSSGYGLYLLRMPVSITPGECTFEGHGADLAVAVEHEFRPDFLPTTFRILAVNDVVDQIGPVVHELIVAQGPVPAGAAPGQLPQEKARLEKDREEKLNQLAATFRNRKIQAQVQDRIGYEEMIGATADRFADFIVRPLEKGREAMTAEAVENRLEALAAANVAAIERVPQKLPRDSPVIVIDRVRRAYDEAARLLRKARDDVRIGSDPAMIKIGGQPSSTLHDYVASTVGRVIKPLIPNMKDGDLQPPPDREDPDREALVNFLRGLYDTALTTDVVLLDKAAETPLALQDTLTRPLARMREDLFKLKALKVPNLPSMRSPKQSYPIAPRELSRFFLAENLAILAADSRRALLTKTPRATDVRNYLRQSLYGAYDVMSRPLAPAAAFAGAPAVAGPAPLEDIDFMDRLRDAIERRRFAETDDESDFDKPSALRALRDELVHKLARGRSNVVNQPIAALCWAIAVDAALLDAAFRDDARATFAAAGLPCPDIDAVRFYDPDDDAARGVFHEYVRRRWPIVTFAIEPVVDQQNIADSFNLKRDLQLALAYSFATGQINFNQVNTFRRQLDQASDTIALNRTVSGYAHGTDTFGFRFTPRFQNPPNQRSNFGVIASQLVAGGPGPDYGTRHSKLEPGIRELTAAVLVPGFLPTVRMQVSGNWFKLTDPEHLVVPTRRMMEQGRRVQELRGEFAAVSNAQAYRAEDLRVLGAKINQVEAMLPQQSRVVLLPFANTASGFDLFAEGSTAMAPELSGFEGLDAYKPGTQSDIFVFGKYFSIHETHVIVGGVPLAKDAFAIVSREVLQVRLPEKALTTTADDGKVYVEVHVATPNGISNRLLVPIDDAAKPKPGTPKLDAKTAKIAVSYQWVPINPVEWRLETSEDPDKDNQGIVVDWDEGAALPPSALQVKVQAKLGDRTIEVPVMAVRASAGVYKADRRQFVWLLLREAQSVLAPRESFPATVKASVSVRPDFREFSADFQAIADPLEIDFSNVTRPVPTPPTPGPAAVPRPDILPPGDAKPAFGPGASSGRRGSGPLADPAVRPTVDLTLPPLPPSIPIPTPSTAAPSAAAAMLLGLGPNPSAAEAAAIRARLATPPVSLNPTTVVVVPPRPEPKKKEHHLRLFGKPRPSPAQPAAR